MLKVKALINTCLAFPSQWEGVLEDGRAIYIRFRWGRLTVSAGASVDDAIMNHEGNILAVDVGGPTDGMMDERELEIHTREVLSFRLTPAEMESEGK